MTKKDIFKKLQQQYIDNLNTACYIAYRDDSYGTTEQGKKEREADVKLYELLAREIPHLMELFGIPKKWIKEFNASRYDMNADSIPYDAKEMWAYKRTSNNCFLFAYNLPKLYDEEGNFIAA